MWSYVFNVFNWVVRPQKFPKSSSSTKHWRRRICSISNRIVVNLLIIVWHLNYVLNYYQQWINVYINTEGRNNQTCSNIYNKTTFELFIHKLDGPICYNNVLEMHEIVLMKNVRENRGIHPLFTPSYASTRCDMSDVHQ